MIGRAPGSAVKSSLSSDTIRHVSIANYRKMPTDNAPSRKTSLPVWLRARSGLMLEISLVLVALYALHQFQTRNLLDSDGLQAPPLKLPSLAGPTIDLSEDVRGPTLVYFFAPWCKFCAASAGNLAALRRSTNDQEMSILLVALDWQSADEVREYVARHDLEVPVLLGTRATANDWHIFGYPTYYVLDKSHRIRRKDFGYSSRFGLWWRTRGFGIGSL